MNVHFTQQLALSFVLVMTAVAVMLLAVVTAASVVVLCIIDERCVVVTNLLSDPVASAINDKTISDEVAVPRSLDLQQREYLNTFYDKLFVTEVIERKNIVACLH